MKLDKSHASSIFKKNVRKFLRNKLAMIGMIVMLVILLMCVFAPIFTSYRPDQPDFSARTIPPSAGHIFGTDKLGRDVFSRILYGGRYSILIGVTGAFFGSLIGVVLGAIAGYFGRWIDTLIVRTSEIFQTVPNMILILILGAVFGRSIGNLLFIFAVTGWMTTFRMVRNEFIALKGENYAMTPHAVAASFCAACGYVFINTRFIRMSEYLAAIGLQPIISIDLQDHLGGGQAHGAQQRQAQPEGVEEGQDGVEGPQ